MQDQILNDDIDITENVLNYLNKHDHESFQKELGKYKEGLGYFQIEWLKKDLDEKFYSDEFLYDELEDFYEELRENCISTEEAEKLIRENPHYKSIFDEREKARSKAALIAEQMRSDILERIPDNPVNLYPAARRLHRNFVLHIGPTNSGKTYASLEALKKAENGVYLGPLRLLAYECYEKLNADGIPCNMITGEEERLVEGAKHTASTVELLNTSKHYAVAVIDEAQMISDRQRGGGWTTAILGVCADEVHVCFAPEAEDLIIQLIEMCGDSYTIVRCERSVPLKSDNEPFIFPKTVQSKDALIVFSKAKVLGVAADLQKKGKRCSVIYGSLPYEARQNEVKRFIEGDTDVIVATDAIGMGMNLPIKRICFLELKKFDGISERRLTPSEAQQIAGRAGRRGIYDVGLYTCTFDLYGIQSLINSAPGIAVKAVLNFSPSLIDVEGKLSDIIQQWEKMADYPKFKKQDTSDMLELCTELEKYSNDKHLIYNFITIPFDTKNVNLHATWITAFHKELHGEHLEYSLPVFSKRSLDDLEQAYKYCDLMYFYRRRFCGREGLQEIAAHKANITRCITEILVKLPIKGKRCRECGKELPWDYPYPMCEKCHSMLYSYRNYNDDWY